MTERLAQLVPSYVQRLVPYVPGKPVEELERELGIENAVKLASNESPLGPSPEVVRAIGQAATELHRYPDASTHWLRHELAAHLDRKPDEIVLGNGSNELIDLISRTFVSPDEHAVFGMPSFVCYHLCLTAANVPFTAVPLTDHLAWDVDALLSAVTPKTRLLFVANPNNPTGAHIGHSSLERLLRELPEQVLAVVDEAYFEFADAEDYRSALTMMHERERMLVLRTFSKAYGMAALRVGYAIGRAEVVGYLNRTRAPFNVGTLGQVAARAALRDRDHLARYVALNREQRAQLREGLSKLGVRVAPSQTNFLFANVERPGKEVYESLLRLGVIVRPMPEPVSEWLRITVGLPNENERLLGAMSEVLRR